MLKLFYLLVVFCIFAVNATKLHHKQWRLWKTQHNKKYVSESEEALRHSIWLSNKKFIDEHNIQNNRSYTLKMNHFGDLTIEEYHDKYTSCYKKPDIFNHNFESSKKYFELKGKHPADLPETVDWRTKNAVTRIKDMGQCGSCYAFSAVGALEGAHALAHDKLVCLSEQNVIDCSVPYGNHGCNGGNMDEVFRYVIDNDGINREDAYVYTGKQGQCDFHRDFIGTTERGVVQIPPGDEVQLQLAVATAGPVSVAIDGSSNAFRFYERGIFDEPNCSTTKLNYAMLIIGYGEEYGKPYWLLKNSMGQHWGTGGYIKMSKDKANQCGIATDASFPTL